MNSIAFYEFFLSYLTDLEHERDNLMEKFRKGKSLRVIMWQLYEIQVKIDEVNRLFHKMKPWFD